LTEKLLLYGGAVQLAGSVTAREKSARDGRATGWSWKKARHLHQLDGSQFDYDGYRLNLLDTPGHKDFSEDTYRVLTAVVMPVVMSLIPPKGIEPQTRKLLRSAVSAACRSSRHETSAIAR